LSNNRHTEDHDEQGSFDATAEGNQDTPRKRAPGRFHGRVEESLVGCDVPGCMDLGEFRAPPAYGKSSGYDGPGEYRWFCLEHIRAFNAGYDFFSGMSEDDIYEAQRPHSGWENLSRAYTSNGNPPPKWEDFSDPLDAIGARFGNDYVKKMKNGANPSPTMSRADTKALKTLGLSEETDAKQIRKRYSELVRQYHPDRNGGDRSHEKVLAKVISAYTQLKTSSVFAEGASDSLRK